jgi:hypothetical protein
MAGLVPAIHVAQPHRRFAFDHVQPDSSPAPLEPNRVDGPDMTENGMIING